MLGKLDEPLLYELGRLHLHTEHRDVAVERS